MAGRHDLIAAGPDVGPAQTANSRRAVAVAVFALAAFVYFLTYRPLNDQFDRLARAHQIAVFGDVPFRDFFDPGYFLTLYVSAALERILGGSLLGELLLNITFMAAGTALVFVMAARISRSTFWGVMAATLVMAGQPRAYDYDKVLFYPLGLFVCWRYIDRPSLKSLLVMLATTVFAGLFRYDSGVYIGTAVLVAILARHWGEWKLAGSRLTASCLAMALLAAPALIFIQATAGLPDAFEQVRTYAAREASRGNAFHPAGFEIDRTAPLTRPLLSEGVPNLFIFADSWWLPGYLTKKNAGACLYWMAVGLPLAAVALVALRRQNRRSGTLARVLCFATLAELTALFILRDPITARVPAVIPLIVIGGSYLIGEAITRPEERLSRTVAAAGGVLCLCTTISIGLLVQLPPKANLDIGRRLSQFSSVPPSPELWPTPSLLPLVTYLRACTKPEDRIFAGWFVGELYYFTGRGFAAGLPVVFGDHWSELKYQRRSLDLFAQQSVPVVVTSPSSSLDGYASLRDFIVDHYEPVTTTEQDGLSQVQIWARRGLPAERRYGDSALPCYVR